MKLSNGHGAKPDLTSNGTLIMDEPQQNTASAPAQHDTNLSILALDDDDNDEDMTSLAMIPRYLLNGHAYNLHFEDKSSIIQYEMERVSQQLIEKMSDPVNELGKFIQTLSVNKSISMESNLFIFNHLYKHLCGCLTCSTSTTKVRCFVIN